jgi:hypothetical protein
MKKLLAEISRRNSTFYWFGWVNVFLLLLFCVFSIVDETIVLGVNAWYKPMKFALSIWIYLWTMSWFMPYFPDGKRKVNVTFATIAIMVIEMGSIAFQAARGTTSHFNIQGFLNSFIFMSMGLAIAANTVLLIYFAIKIFRNNVTDLEPVMKRGIIWGIGIVVIASIEGGVMGAIFKHTIGASEASPGIPFLNWSKVAGDLRIAHFVGIHAMQVLPICGYLIFKFIPSNNQVFGINVVGVLYTLLVAALFLQAIHGVPLFK